MVMKLKGFTLIELGVYLALAAIALIAAYPYLQQSVRYGTANKITADALEVVDAADIFYSMNCSLPVVSTPTVEQLKSAGLLSSVHDFVNPWGGGFTVSYENPKSMKTRVVVSAVFNTPGIASFVKGASREASVAGSTVYWFRTPTIINDLSTIGNADDLELFSSRPCFIF